MELRTVPVPRHHRRSMEMKGLFYPKLAATSLMKNRRIYMPYILASTGAMALFYIMYGMSENEGIMSMSGAAEIKQILTFGSVVVGIFSVIFLFYINSFLIKRRKKEIGLLNVLGMGKGHIAKAMFFETLITSGIIFLGGILSGILLNRLIFMILMRLMGIETSLNPGASVNAVLVSLMLFGGIFITAYLVNLLHIHVANPIELLKGGNVGEREPKSKIVLTVIGILSLGSGYAIAIIVKSPLMAISLFFVAVVLVMIGTYCLFTAGSIVILKLLRKNKDFYYRAGNFTSVSNMIYRMKQNAVGLSNICILSTAVLVMMSSTLSLYSGMEDILNTRFASDMNISSAFITEEIADQIAETVTETLNNHDITPFAVKAYSFHTSILTEADGIYIAEDRESMGMSFTSAYMLNLVTAETYNKLEGQSLNLKENEAIVFTNSENYAKETINLNGLKIAVIDEIDTFAGMTKEENAVFAVYYMVVKDNSMIQKVLTQLKGDFPKELTYNIGFDLEESKEKEAAFTSDLITRVRNEIDSYVNVDSRELRRESFMRFHGGLLFLGIFLGLLFLMATALIIYYKQISEGYDDQERYVIMQKVGMSHQEVRSTIRKQITMVFFLPLIGAVIHIAAAFKMITRLLAVFEMTNEWLFFLCTLGSIVAFALVYIGVYSYTARSYYRIVKA